ncbi:MAG: PadR family transcriptional regulator [Ktedonobacteraceae bacterium]
MHISEPAEYAILGLLEERPMHGYELYQHFQNEPLDQIVHIEMSQLYAFLKKLAHLALIEAMQDQQGGRPQRKVYNLTSAGRTTLQEWLTVPVERPRDIRIFFLIKLYFLQRLLPTHLAKVIAQEIETCQHFLAALEAQRHGPSSICDQAAFNQVVVCSRIYQTQALLAWLCELHRAIASE